jgi:3-dehydroquinate dehydratase-1
MGIFTVPIKAVNPEKLELLMSSKHSDISAYEIWIDQLKILPENLESFFQTWKKISKKILVAVCKNPKEQGKFNGTDYTKVDLLLAASAGGADYVDIGLHSSKAELRRLKKGLKKTKLIISHHDFKKTPSEAQLKSIVKKMRQLGADVCKIATMVNDLDDNRRLIELAIDLKKRKVKHIIIGMGEQGMITRILSKELGNELQFVSLESKTAPGQLSLSQAFAFENVLKSL